MDADPEDLFALADDELIDVIVRDPSRIHRAVRSERSLHQQPASSSKTEVVENASSELLKPLSSRPSLETTCPIYLRPSDGLTGQPLSARTIAQTGAYYLTPRELDQSRLNIVGRTRTSRLPWRGQFSPELIDYLIEAICPHVEAILDPFCGSGTVLFEAVEKRKSALGFEINPAAWHLASLSGFASLDSRNQEVTLKQLKTAVSDFGKNDGKLFPNGRRPTDLLQAVSEHSSEFMKHALASVILLGMGDKPELSSDAIARGSFIVMSLLNKMRGTHGRVNCCLGDARMLRLDDASIDAVITSPPYINVFNYHQNYRPAAELLGWTPLEAARSEIGSNRKNRGNRFRTVIQYCLDMADSLSEMSRVLKPGGRMVLVVGRTSNVLGASFKNGDLVHKLLSSTPDFLPVLRHERVFTSRFGENIFEDILVWECRRRSRISHKDARDIALEALLGAKNSVPKENSRALYDAIADCIAVVPSPVLAISVPPAFMLNLDTLQNNGS